MPAERIKALEDEVAALKEANDALYRQHANEKAQMQIAIEHEKLQVAELMDANAAFREENDAWRASYDALECARRETEELWANERQAMEEKIRSLEENLQTYTTELVNDLEQVETDKQEIARRDKAITELQQQLNESSDRFSQLMKEYDGVSIALHQATSDTTDQEQQYMALEAHLRDYASRLETQVAELQSQLQATSQNEKVMESTQQALLQQVEQDGATKDIEIARLTERITQLEEEVGLLALTSGAGESKSTVVTTLRDLQQQLFHKSEELVQQGETHLQMAVALDKHKQTLHSLRREVDGVRSSLLKGIVGEDVDEAAYENVKLAELVRLRLKSIENELRVLNAATFTSRANAITQRKDEGTDPEEDAGGGTGEEGDEADAERQPLPTHLASVGSFSAVESFGVVGRLERELRLAKSRNKRLLARIEQLEHELGTATANVSEFQALKERTVEIVSRERVEKELRAKAEANYKETTEKIVALSEHIEKLMVHLKHEAAAKTKAVDLHRRTDKELTECRDKLAVVTKKSAVKDQQVQELEHGAKILEDQLRLMDEKFIDVRTKLDWTRATSQKETKRLQSELNGLRMKWQMASDMGALSALPDWVNSPKLIKPKSKPLGVSSSEPRLQASSSNNASLPSSTSAGLSPLRSHSAADPMTMRFDIPKLPQPDSEAGTPWSDAKLHGLQRQLQDKRKQ